MNARTLTTLLALLGTSLPAQERKPEHLLRLQFQKGQSTWQQVTTDLTATMERGDKPSVQKIRITVFLQTTVEDVTSEGAKIKHEIYRLKTSGGEGDKDEETYRYDSASDDTTPTGASELATMLGTSVVMELDDHGRLRKLDLPEPVAELNHASGMDFQRMTDLLLPRTLELPETPVAVGAKWLGTPAKIEGPADYATKSSYELVAVENQRAHIRHDLVIRLRDTETEEEKKVGLELSRMVVVDLVRGHVLREEESLSIRPNDARLIGMNLTLTAKRILEETDGKRDGKGETREVEKAAPATSRPTKGAGKR